MIHSESRLEIRIIAEAGASGHPLKETLLRDGTKIFTTDPTVAEIFGIAAVGDRTLRAETQRAESAKAVTARICIRRLEDEKWTQVRTVFGFCGIRNGWLDVGFLELDPEKLRQDGHPSREHLNLIEYVDNEYALKIQAVFNRQLCRAQIVTEDGIRDLGRLFFSPMKAFLCASDEFNRLTREEGSSC